jgi:DNA polymerase-3 subunit gamma/tau
VEITQGTSLDVHELDAASNNGVDAMRDLVAHAALGTPGRWKVYIVDEVHMLSTAAANSLLKTLEEPPSHVVFVLATTEPQKVPATIRSRTQHLEFRLLSADTLHSLLEDVRQQGALEVTDDALQIAVRRGHGSARDALSALDQVVASGTADARPEVSAAVRALADGNTSEVLVCVHSLLAEGWGPQQLATDIIDELRQIFLVALAPQLSAIPDGQHPESKALVEEMGLARVVRSMELLGHALVDMRDAPDAQVVLELALVRAVRPDLDQETAALAERVATLERHLAGVATPGAGAPGMGTSGIPQREASVQERTPLEDPPAGTGGRQPSLGAVLRSRGEAGGTDGPAEMKPVVPPSPEPAVVAEGGTAPATPSSPLSTSGEQGEIDRDALTQAWGDGVLHSLPARVKALYSAGRFVAFGADGAHFALPNVAHRDRCVDLVPQVEAALSERFGAAVRLVLEVDSRTVDTSRSQVSQVRQGPNRAAGAPVDVIDEGVDEHEVVESLRSEVAPSEHESAAVDRLMQAFPGASEVAD